MKKTAQILLIPSFLLLLFTTLSSHITCYNEKTTAGGYTIALSQTITLITNTTSITNASTGVTLAINGDGHTIDGDQVARILNIQNSDVTVTDITITNGLADSITCAGGIRACGGGIYIGSSGIVTISHTTIYTNSADFGGGVINDDGSLIIRNSTLSKNSGVNKGGAIYNLGTLGISHSTVVSNVTTGSSAGGGIFNESTGTVIAINNTFSENSSPFGGAVFARGTFTATNNTFFENSSAIQIDEGLLVATNNIIANSSPDENCSAFNIDIDSSNITTDNSCGDATEKTSAELNLGTLQDNGGDTWTHALLTGSHAIDAGSTTLTTDQRGISRPQGSATDVGAYEFFDCDANPIPVTVETDLNTAIGCYNAKTVAGSYTISLTQSITLITNTTTIDNSTAGVELLLAGNGFTIDGDNKGRGLLIENGVATLTDLTIQNGIADNRACGHQTAPCGGGIYISATAIVTVSQAMLNNNSASEDGGAVFNNGTLVIGNSTISNNSASVTGGGIANFDTGKLTINDSTLSENTSVFSGAGMSNYNVATINNSTFYSNSASADGGGIYSGWLLTVTNSTFSGNSAEDDGGGIATRGDGESTVTNSTFSSNSADSNGGGIYVENIGTIILNNSIVANSINGNDCSKKESGSISFTGSNLIEDNSCSFTGGSDPNLGPLQDNGGNTWTHALLTGSSAIDAGDSALATDQRGVTRPQGSNPDIGSFELVRYDLEVSNDGNGNGTISDSSSSIDCGITCTAQIGENTIVTLTATAEVDSSFAGWSGDVSGTANLITLTVDAAKNVTATFTFNSYTVTSATDGTGSGSITKSPDMPTYTHGTIITLTATAGADSTFSGWSGDVTGTTNLITLTVDATKNVTATFPLNSYTIASATAGTGSGSITKSPDIPTYTLGTIVTLTATADTGSTFSGWSGDIESTTDSITLTVDASKNVTATFTLNSYTLSSGTAGTGSGSVTKSPDMPTYTHGAVVTLTATADTGSTFTGWTGDVTATTDLITITMSQAKNVSALFSLNQYTLTTNTVGNGSGTISRSPNSPTYTYGTMVMLAAEPAAGSTFTGWSDPGCGVTSTCLVKVDQAKTILASFGLVEPTGTIIYLPIILQSP